MNKRIIAATAALAMVFPAASSVFAADGDVPETDIAAADDEIYAMADDIPSDIGEINDTYDETVAENTCETETDGFTLESGAPDGTSYLVSGDSAATICDMGTDSSEDYMWETDVRFDNLSSGFTVYSKTAKSKVGTCVRRYDGSDGSTPQLAIQTGSKSYTNICEIDTDAWYHIRLIGQHGTSEALLMTVSKWEDGTLTYLGSYDNIDKRNNPPSSYIRAEKNTSFDNVRITKLGADELTISSMPEGTTEINAGSNVQLQYSATRKGRSINKPAVEWKVFEGDTELEDGSVVADSDGKVAASADCADKTVTVKAISTEKGSVEGAYDLTVKSVDFDSLKYDTLTLTADSDYVESGSQLALTLTATKNGETVELAEGDVVWSAYDEDDVQATGNEYIYVQNNTLYVDSRVISQNIILRAENESGTVRTELPLKIKSSDVSEEDGADGKDVLLVSNACEDTSKAYLTSGSWDGSHYFNVTAVYDMDGVTSTTEDVIIEADVKFTEDNSGVLLRDEGNNKLGGQIQRQGSQIGKVGSGNSFTAFCTGDAESWYHITITARCGADNSYGTAAIYKYDSDGSLVDPDTGEENKAATGTLDLRTMSDKSFAHLQVYAGTGIDNMRVMRLVPDEIKVSMSADSIFAGNTMQASYTAYHDGTEIPSFPQSRVKWSVYDSENMYPVEDSIAEIIAVDATGLISVDATASEQTVYIRAISVDGAAVYGASPLTVKSSDIFDVTGIGLNAAGDTVLELKVEKKFYYNGDVTFVVAAYDAEGKLINIGMRELLDNTLSVGENLISVDMTIPDNFDSVRTFIWTAL